VALVFSCVTGILGVIVVGWYGMANPSEVIPTDAKERVADVQVVSPPIPLAENPATEEITVAIGADSGGKS
jgi:iron transport multicopper oxidase